MNCQTIHFSRHAVERMFERAIAPKDVRTVLAKGEIVEEYPLDTPYPSCLILGFVGNTPIHVVAAYDSAGNCQVITVYVPDERVWEKDFKSRRTK